MDNMLAMHQPLIFAPRTSTSSSSSSSSSSLFASAQQSTRSSGHVTKRPKMSKKANSSTNTKQRSVQQSLEAKVEKSRGWNAFFVPLARGMPGAPPSSPVLAAQGQSGMGGHGLGHGHGDGGMEGGRGQFEHVEHVVLPPASFEIGHGSSHFAQAPSSLQSQLHLQHSHRNQHPHPSYPHTSAPASPTASTTCGRSDRSDAGTDLSRETTRSFASIEEYREWEKWAKENEQWVEHAVMMPTFELGPGQVGAGLGIGMHGHGQVGRGLGGDVEMEQ